MSTMNGDSASKKYFEPGDLVYFKSNGSLWDFFILLVSEKYTHMGVAVSEDEFVEATIGGIKLTTYNPKWNADVYGIKDLESLPYAHKKSRLFTFAARHFGEPYSYVQALSAGVLRLLGLKRIADKIDRNWFCSEWAVYHIAESLGVRLVPEITYSDILPEDPLRDKQVFKRH